MHKLLTFLVAFFPYALSAQPLQAFVEQSLRLPVLDGALWGGTAVCATDPGTPLFDVHATTRLTPASTLKLLTTAAALETLGPRHRFQTRLYASSKPDEHGVLQGDLYLQGGGDMTLGSTRVVGGEPYQAVLDRWVRAIQRVGIKQITGRVIADISLFEGPSLSPKVNWENMGNYFAAPASPLSFNDNLFEIHFKPQWAHDQLTEIAGTVPQAVGGVSFENFVRTDGKNKKDNAYVYAAPGQYQLKIFGTIPTNLTGFSIKAALPDPALFTAQALTLALQQSGIAVSSPAATTRTAPDYATLPLLLDTYQSPELKDIIVIVNKRSFNLYADMLLRHLALASGKAGSIENGVQALKQFLKQHRLANDNDVVLYDGSGLARDNLLTPQVLVNVLTFMAQRPNFEYYYNSLATPDDRGDLLVLRNFLKKLFKKADPVRVKGGTIDGVKALAGYARTEDEKLVAFAFIANNLAGKDETLLRMHENIIKKLLEPAGDFATIK